MHDSLVIFATKLYWKFESHLVDWLLRIVHDYRYYDEKYAIWVDMFNNNYTNFQLPSRNMCIKGILQELFQTKLTIWDIFHIAVGHLAHHLGCWKCPMMLQRHHAEFDSTWLPPTESMINNFFRKATKSLAGCWIVICNTSTVWSIGHISNRMGAHCRPRGKHHASLINRSTVYCD